ncbi:MAG TPA: serine hydrolase domain-containing protein, partial [Armatimonadota bacterium]|nr:serine hydrolase domain-containing protein [Armatimonadota bacterium]
MAVRQESPEEAGFDGKRLERLAALLEQAVAAGETPGAVALVADRQCVVFHRAFGHAQVVPRAEPMRPDTLFDLASLTKVVATAPAILLLVEAGAIRLQDRVVEFIPEFAG